MPKKRDDEEFVSEMPGEALHEEVLGQRASHTSSTRRDASASVDQSKVTPGGVVFDPFVEEEAVDSIKTQVEEVERRLNEGEIDEDQAIRAMARIYRMKHSMGNNILYDNRVKVENRILRYCAWATSQGTDLKEAKSFATREILKSKDLGGNWGKIKRQRRI